ncbi:MAG: hypothetical protein Q8P44_04240, partial [Dehalococcoidia bacterium]|nr:hypothetical protein [Dehalococcoidia bacterium]
MKTYTMKGSPDASSFTHSDESRNPVIIMNDYSVYVMDSVVSHKWPYNIKSLSISLYERERLFSPFEKGDSTLPLYKNRSPSSPYKKRPPSPPFT